MAFTYSGDPSTSRRDAVRFLLGDTVDADAVFADAELDFLLAEWGNPYGAAIAAADAAAARYSRQAQSLKRTVGDLSIDETYSDRAAHFQSLRSQLALQRDGRYPPTPWVDPASLAPSDTKASTGKTTDLWISRFDNRGE